VSRIYKWPYNVVIASVRGDSIDYVGIQHSRAIVASKALFWTVGLKRKRIEKLLSSSGSYVIVYKMEEVLRASTAISEEIRDLLFRGVL
jgi:hypothetical protein